MAYINTETSQYPLSELDIKASFPENTSFPDVFIPPDNYEVVFASPVPVYDVITQGVREVVPTLTNKGTWEQSWEVYDLPIEQVTLNQQQAVSTLQANITNAIQGMLDSKAKEFEYDSIHTACGWATDFPDAARLKSWGASCWLKSKQIREEVETGLRPMPTTVEEVLSEMPVFV